MLFACEGSIAFITDEFTIILCTASKVLVSKAETAGPLPRATNTS